MVEYIIRTDKPMRFEACLNLNGIHHYSVRRLGKHGDLIERDTVLSELKKYYKVGELAEVGEVACFIDEAEVILEANNG